MRARPAGPGEQQRPLLKEAPGRREEGFVQVWVWGLGGVYTLSLELEKASFGFLLDFVDRVSKGLYRISIGLWCGILFLQGLEACSIRSLSC